MAKKTTAKPWTVPEVLQWLEKHGSKKVREEMLTRYGITAPKAWGVKVGMLHKLAKQVGRDHSLALKLWDTGWYEARLLTAFIDEPAKVTAAQMDKQARDFDNWAIVDTLCFKLWDQLPHAWAKVEKWAIRREEFIKRAGFALLACLALHNRQTPEERFLNLLPLIERGATDERNFVKKGISWALRSIGRRSRELNTACVELAQRLIETGLPSARWIGKDAVRELTGAVVRKHLKK
jgi:3-methyladenine DNA glycosylase AlkD